MAISLRACGSWAAVNATTQTVTLPTHAAGDMLIVRAACKPYTASITCSTSGWTAVGTGYANGSTANGNGVGSLMHRAFYKIATSDAETNPVIDWGTTADPGGAVALSYQKGAGEAWVTPTGAGGGDSTARTSQTCTIGSHISVTAGDMVDFFLAWCDNYASTDPTITQTGVTYGTVSEQPATALSSGTGNDMAADGGYRLASSGTSSAAAVVTATFGNSEQGGAWQTRLRVIPNTNASAGLASATATARQPTNHARAGVAAVTGTAEWGSAGTSPTVAFTCGAECAALADWTALTGPTTRSTSQHRSGAAAIKIAAAGAITMASKTLATQAHFVARFSVYLDGLPGADCRLFEISSTTVKNQCIIFDVATGKLGVAREDDFAGKVLGPVIVNQTWTTVDVHFDFAAPSISWQVGGVAQTTYTGSGYTGTGDYVQAGQGTAYGGLPALTTYTAYFDDVVISNTAGDYPIDDGYVVAGETWTPASTIASAKAKIGAQAGAIAATAVAYQPPFAAAATGNAGLASATASGKTDIARIGAQAAHGQSTAAANAATFKRWLNVSAGLATATAAAIGTGKTVGARAGLAQATAAVPATIVRVKPAAIPPQVLAFGWDVIPLIKPAAGLASGTGAAHAPPPSIGANAGLAAATATAYDATASTAVAVDVDAGLAAATAAATAAIPKIGGVSGLAAATGTARQPISRIASGVGAAGATAAGLAATGKIGGVSGIATASASAVTPSVKVSANAGLAAATASAPDATWQVAGHTEAQAGLASATAAGLAAVGRLGAQAGLSTATGTAYGATDKVGAAAVLDAVTASALAPTAKVSARAGIASATASASADIAKVGAQAALVTATAAALGAAASIRAQADIATATATAYAATLSTPEQTNAPAGAAVATSSASAATASVKPNAGTAAATASGKAAIPKVSANAGRAEATAMAYAATSTLVSQAHPGPVDNTATARQPSVSVKANAGVATATASANAAIGGIRPPAGRAQATVTALAASKTVGPVGGVAAATANGHGALWSSADTILVWAGLATATASATRAYQGGTGGKPPRGIAATDTGRLVVSPPRPNLDATAPRGRGTAGGPRPRGRAEVDIPRG